MPSLLGADANTFTTRLPLVFWELFFMLVILKIPVVYLCTVVWWAIRAEPLPPAGAARRALLPTGPGCDWRGHRPALRPGPLPRLGGPHGRRPPRIAYARARTNA
jgi:hypothetical protein